MKQPNIKTNTELVPIRLAVEGFEQLFQSPNSPLDESGIWAEPQLYLLPFCVPQHRVTTRFKPIKISETVNVAGVDKYRSFTVVPHPEFGLPGTFDLEVMTGVYRIADQLLKETGIVPEFIEIPSLRGFLESIGKTGAGVYTRKLKESLKRLAGTMCISEGFFYSKPRNLYIVDSFTFITSLEILGETDFNGHIFEMTRMKLHEFIRSNLNSNFRTLIDFEYLRTFRTDIAKSVTLHLAYRMFKNKSSEWIVDYEWLAQRIGVQVHSDVKRAKDQLKEAFSELEKRLVIDSFDWLPGNKLKFLAGPYLIKLHAKRVAAKDAWLASEQDRERTELLVTAHPPRTAKEAERHADFDPLAPLCAEYAYRGWQGVAERAMKKGLAESDLQVEAQKRGHSCCVTTA